MTKVTESKWAVGRGKRSLLNVGLVCISVVISFVAVELLLQTTDFRKHIPVTDSDGMRYYYEKSHEMGFDISPNYNSGTARFVEGGHEVFSDSYGCFDREVPLSGLAFSEC